MRSGTFYINWYSVPGAVWNKRRIKLCFLVADILHGLIWDQTEIWPGRLDSGRPDPRQSWPAIKTLTISRCTLYTPGNSIYSDFLVWNVNICVWSDIRIIKPLSNWFDFSLAWVPVWSFCLLFYFSVSWSKMTAWGTLISIDSDTWIFPQILRGNAKNDNSIG